MADEVTISNLALSKLGADDQIRDPNEDSHAARSIRAVWAPIRRAVLRKANWNCAMTRAELSALDPASAGYASPYPYQNRFPVPADFCRFCEILGPPNIVSSYRFERRAVLADTAGPVFIRYVADVAETGLWDDLFVEAFASRLAFQIADRITGDRGRKSDAWALYQKALTDAVGVDAKEDPPTVPEEDEWILARYS